MDNDIVSLGDRKLFFTGHIIDGESINSGSGSIDFQRLDLTQVEFDALSLPDTQEQYYLVNKVILDQRDEITNVVSVTGNTMEAGTDIVISLYNRIDGFLTTITQEFGEVTAGNNEIITSDDAAIGLADWFTIEYKFNRSTGVYNVKANLIVKKKIVENGSGSGAYEFNISTATPGQTNFNETFSINNVYVDNVFQTTNISGRGTTSIVFSPALSGSEEVFLST